MAANTILDGIILCGIDNAITHGLTTSPAQRVATEVFSDDFNTCIDLSDAQLDSMFKTFASLNVNQGQVRLMPGRITRIKAFTQFVCHQTRLGIDPATVAFNPADQVLFNSMRVTQKKFVDDSSDLASSAKPAPFTTTTKWLDWAKTFYNYLRLLPSRNGIPICYIIRENAAPNRAAQPNFLDTYVNAAPLIGVAFNDDSAKVYIVLKKLVEEHSEASMIVSNHELSRDGRAAYLDLQLKFEGEGVHSQSRAEATDDIERMFYNGEKPPHMTWDSFETRLKNAYIMMDKIENVQPGQHAFSDNYKLSKLLKNVKADFMEDIKASIMVEISAGRAYTFDMALKAFGNKVVQKYPKKSTGDTNVSKRHMREARSQAKQDRKRKADDTKQVGFKHRNQVRSQRQGSETIKLKNGNFIDYHPAYNFEEPVFKQLPDWVKDKMKRQRKEHKERMRGDRRGGGYGNDRQIEEMSARIVENVQRQLSQAGSIPATVDMDGNSTIASNRERNDSSGNSSARRSIMGGRNEQARRRQDGPQ